MINYTDRVNPIARDLKPSGIRKFFDIAVSRKNCISLGVGEPDFVTPEPFRKAGIASIENGKTQYTANVGLQELRYAISRYMHNFIGQDYNPHNQIMLTVGGSEGLDLAIRSLCVPGDEFLVPDPSFVSYAPLISLTGATPVPIHCDSEHKFKVTAEELEKVITPKTKGVILPFPNNPTGAVMTKEDLEKIAPIILKHDLFVISDEIYGELQYNNVEFTSISSLPDMYERTVIVSGFSKAFAMTGWRLGYICAPQELLNLMYKIHQYGIMCAPTASQYCALAALETSFENGFAEVTYMREKYDERRRYLVDRLNAMGLTCFEPEGAFYAFPCVKSTGMDGEQFAYALLDSKNVAVVPGIAFGESGKDFVRISYAYSVEAIKKAMDLIEEFLKELKK